MSAQHSMETVLALLKLACEQDFVIRTQDMVEEESTNDRAATVTSKPPKIETGLIEPPAAAPSAAPPSAVPSVAEPSVAEQSAAAEPSFEQLWDYLRADGWGCFTSPSTLKLRGQWVYHCDSVELDPRYEPHGISGSDGVHWFVGGSEGMRFLQREPRLLQAMSAEQAHKAAEQQRQAEAQAEQQRQAQA